MSCEGIAAKIKKTLISAESVLIMLQPTPTKVSITIRSLPAQRLEMILANPGKWADWYMLGVYNKLCLSRWLRDDIEFAFKKEGMFRGFEY